MNTESILFIGNICWWMSTARDLGRIRVREELLKWPDEISRSLFKYVMFVIGLIVGNESNTRRL